MHVIGAVLAVTTIWDIGDVALSLVTLPNVISLLLLSGLLKRLTDSYFERKPWLRLNSETSSDAAPDAGSEQEER
jgi:AGCS family alanine or glycine:cation symporter